MEALSTTAALGVSTPHPRACAICARAKAKCVAGDRGKCQRCHRLKKVCEPSQAQYRSQPRKRRSTPVSRVHKNQVEKLEEKLDGLVTLLRSTQELRVSNEAPIPMNFNISPSPSRTLPPLSTESQSSHEEIPGQGWIHFEIINSTASSQPSLAPDSLVITPENAPSCHDHLPGPPIPQTIDISSDQANLLLNRWRVEIAPFFPFIIVPPLVTAQDLQRDRPYLLKSILAVASRDYGQQAALGKWLVRQLAERMVINGERNMDLLLGVLTYMGWCSYNCYNIPQLTCLLSLGMTLIIDLGLNRPPPNASSNRSLFEIALRETVTNPGVPRPYSNIKNTRNLEDRRALLGMFFLSSAASKYFRSKVDPLRTTPYFYECLETLEKAQDQPTDICATSLVRLQLIVERIFQAPWNDDYGVTEHLSSSPPPILYVKSIQEQLKAYRSAMSPEIGTESYIWMHYHYVEGSLYEVALSRDPVVDSLSGRDFHRLEMLYACLQSNKLFWKTFFTIPEYRYVCFSLATWIQVGHSMMVLQLLSTFEHPDWNLPSVRETIDFMKVMDQLIERFKDVDGGILARISTKLAGVKAHIQAAMEPKPGTLVGEDADMGLTWEPFDFLDVTWLGDISEPVDTRFDSIPGI